MELIHLYFPWNHQKTYGFLIILGEIEVKHFAQICSLLEGYISFDDIVV